MRTLLLLCFFFSLANQSFAQAKLDSILQVLEHSGEFRKTKKINYLMDSFQRYERINEQDFYDVYFDSTGKLAGYCGQAIMHRKYDSLQRAILITGYRIDDGSYYFYDFDPVMEVEYRSDTTVRSYYGQHYEFRRKEIQIKDSLKRLIESYTLNQSLQVEYRQLIRYTDSSYTTYLVDSTGAYTPNEHGVSIIQVVFDTSSVNQHSSITTYLDSHFQLVDALHKKIDCQPFAQIRTVRDEGYGATSIFYNSEGKQDCSDYVFFWWISIPENH
ncbi:MAG: hypothetical protein EP332_03555 [Bacteroidetes bacterium]|nr:MAG: hypothetical protein EP332_03555 [Bacteroidota bacterium]